MERAARKALIEEVENIRGTNVVVYFCSDRRFVSASIAEDVIRPLYDHLLRIREANKSKKIDLFIYSCGGDVGVPWKLVSTIREFCEEFSVLIPYKAYSATTLIAIGGDQIVMGPKGELGPIDPTLQQSNPVQGYQSSVSIEDVSSYLAFMRDRVGLRNQSSLEKAATLLADKITPLTLGRVNREYSHIRLVAQKMFTQHKAPIASKKIKELIEILTEKIYSHGHGIARKEAKQLGLPVIFPEKALEEKMWELFLAYEEFFKMRSPIDPKQIFDGRNDDQFDENVSIGAIESSHLFHCFEGKMKLKRARKMAPNLQLNLQVALPPSINLQNLPAQQQDVVKQLISGIQARILELIREELNKHCPVSNIEMSIIGGRWLEKP